MDVPIPDRPLRELHLFVGCGGGLLGGILLGHTCVCAVEIEPYRRKVLLQRQRDGILPRFPIWDDVTTFDGKPWRGKVDCVCGGFPCQDIAATSHTRTGIDGERSGLWKQMARVVCEVEPDFVFVENSPLLTSRGLSVVLGDLAELGFDAKWGVLGARHTGASTRRDRIWILANSNKKRISRPLTNFSFSQASRQTGELQRLPSETCLLNRLREWDRIGRPSGDIKSPIRRGDDGLADWDEQLRAIGDGQVPTVVKLAWETLSQ